MNAWLLLLFAGLAEVVWAVGLKFSHGFTRLGPSVFTIMVMILSFALLSLALKAIPIGTAYAVWTGIGVVGAATLGVILFGEPVTIGRLSCIGAIVIGAAGLKFLGT